LELTLTFYCLPQLIFSDEIIEGVFVYKLLGVLIDTNLKCDNHIDSICSKAPSRLHFLTQVKRNGATVKDMVQFYETVIWSILEYVCPAWHSSLTVEQCFPIESMRHLYECIQYLYVYVPANLSYSPRTTLSDLLNTW